MLSDHAQQSPPNSQITLPWNDGALHAYPPPAPASDERVPALQKQIATLEKAVGDLAMLAQDANNRATNALAAAETRHAGEGKLVRAAVAEAVKDLARPPNPMTAATMAAFRTLAMVLAVRFMLVLALVGTFVLALLSMDRQTPISVGLTIAFALLTVGPLVFLEVRNRPVAFNPPPVTE